MIWWSEWVVWSFGHYILIIYYIKQTIPRGPTILKFKTSSSTLYSLFTMMPFIKVSLIVIAFLSVTLSQAHPGFHFGWSGHGGTRDISFGLSPQFYQFSCPQANDIVMSVLEKAIAKDMRIAASLLRLHFHDCFVQVNFFFW